MTSSSIFTLEYREQLNGSGEPPVTMLEPVRHEAGERAQDFANAEPLEADGERELIRTETSVLRGDVQILGSQATICSHGCLEVYGPLQANLQSDKIVVGKTASIEGTLIARKVVVFGQVAGSIFGRHVDLYASGGVVGDIHHRTLTIEKGAYFVGRANRVLSPTDLLPDAPARMTPALPKLAADVRPSLESA